MANSRIVGLGRHLPDNVVTNEALTRVMETSEEWIQQRTGIRERRYVDGGYLPGLLTHIYRRGHLVHTGICGFSTLPVILGWEVRAPIHLN